MRFYHKHKFIMNAMLCTKNAVERKTQKISGSHKELFLYLILVIIPNTDRILRTIFFMKKEKKKK